MFQRHMEKFYETRQRRSQKIEVILWNTVLFETAKCAARVESYCTKYGTKKYDKTTVVINTNQEYSPA